MNEPISEKAEYLRNRDFDPNYVPSYAEAEHMDSGKKLRTRLKHLLGPHQKLLTFGMMAGDKMVYKLSDQVRPHKTLNSSIQPEDAAMRITRTYHHYLLFGQLEQLRGRICEIGPGDTAGVSLLALRYGARSSDLVERFDRTISREKQAEIYEALSRIHGLEKLRKGYNWNDNQIEGITWIKESAEDYFHRCLKEGKKYDTIISNAVLEHVDDPISLIERGVELLGESVIMLHQIDLDDHGIYSSLSDHYDELSWLETPDWLYKRFAKNTGRPNRILFHQYKNLLAELKARKKIKNYRLLIRQLVEVGRIPPPGYEYQFLPMELSDRAAACVSKRQNRLAKSLKDVPFADLAVRGFFLSIQK